MGQFSQLKNIGTAECRRFAHKIFIRHTNIDKFLKTNYIKTSRNQGHFSANTDLRGFDTELKAMGTAFSASMDDQEIIDLASLRSKQVEGLYKVLAAQVDVAEASKEIQNFVEAQGVEYPLKITLRDTAKTIAKKCLGAMLRVSDPKWWRRRLRVGYGRQVEAVVRKMGFVRKESAPYISNWSFNRWKISQQRNASTLARLEAVNEEGESIPLLECIEKSISNPVNRRNELMTRLHGFEEIAKGLGLTGLFFTLTAPGKYHSNMARGGKNPNFNGSTPREAMEYLNGVWARIRSEWARNSIKTFGFRVCEPHHDGTPHFHFLLFVHPEEKKKVCDVFGAHALAVDGFEKGAQENRWDVKVIDPKKGSATGYIAKYVSKNIDGYKVGVDEEGECMGDEGAARTRAWASMWGIRQFQQIGAVSVTVWRELRRKKGVFDEITPEEVEKIGEAAHVGDWEKFVNLMGGAFVSRNELALRPMYLENENTFTQYGDDVKKLIGVWLRPVARAIARCVIPTREHVWEIREISEESEISLVDPPLL